MPCLSCPDRRSCPMLQVFFLIYPECHRVDWVAFHQGANIAHQHCINLRYALRTGGRIPIVQPGTIAHHTRTYGGFLSLSCTLYSSPLALMNLDYVIARMTSWPALSNYCVLDSVLTSSRANTSWFFIRVCPISVHMTKFQLN